MKATGFECTRYILYTQAVGVDYSPSLALRPYAVNVLIRSRGCSVGLNAVRAFTKTSGRHRAHEANEKKIQPMIDDHHPPALTSFWAFERHNVSPAYLFTAPGDGVLDYSEHIGRVLALTVVAGGVEGVFEGKPPPPPPPYSFVFIIQGFCFWICSMKQRSWRERINSTMLCRTKRSFCVIACIEK